jgi:uncharacterized protein (TIGR03067 family)
MFRTLSTVLFIMLAIGADNRKEDTAAMSGTWLPASAELSGNPFPEDTLKTMKLEVNADKYIVTVGAAVDKGTVTVDPTANPKTMDITGTDGPNKGKKFLTIYELKGDTLKVCYDLSGKNRPTEFKSKPDTQLFLVIYKREKK